MKKDIKDAVDNCTKVKDNIMNVISELFDDNDISYEFKGDNEIYISKGNKDKVVKLLNKLDIDEDTIKLMVSVNETSSGVFVRQKMN